MRAIPGDSDIGNSTIECYTIVVAVSMFARGWHFGQRGVATGDQRCEHADVISPGRDLASATSSASVFHFASLGTASSGDSTNTRATGSKA
jgi:hypothetical protein